ncbi:hypothetical protein ABT010_35650 [Streptomyces sp. NPDC002668]|uniref:hypothetical protein n=1 Tax=Streptomyces sp. NPDC002668 TaxID=3154422 RepID=UPI00331CF4AB
MAGIPDPMIKTFEPAPAGMVRVVAWRALAETSSAPDLQSIHSERAALLHWWADAYQLEVDDWGETDAQRPAEFVELLIHIGETVLTAGIGALATEYVNRFFVRRKEKRAKKALTSQSGELPPPPNALPLRALTIVNQSGGNVVILDGLSTEDAARVIAQVMNPKWKGTELRS